MTANGLSNNVPGQAEHGDRLRLILDSALDAIVTVDAKGLVTDWNSRAEVLFGWAASEAMGKSMTELFIPHRYRERHERGMRHFLASGEGPILNKRVELSALHRDGWEFPVELTVAPAKSGDSWIFCAFIRDITLSKAAENRLNLQYAVTRILAESDGIGKALPEVLKAIFEHTPWEVGSVWILSDEGSSLQCISSELKVTSPALTDFVGKGGVIRFAKGEGLLGRVWEAGHNVWIPRLEAVDPYQRKPLAIAAGLTTMLAYPIMAGDRFHGVLELFHREEQTPDEETLKVLLHTGSQIGQFIERKMAEAALAQREKDLSDFVDNATVAMHWVGPDGVIQWANNCELEMLGYSHDEYIGHHIADFHADEPIINDIICRVSSREELANYEARLKCKDGSIRHVLINSNALWKDDVFMHTRCFTQDITAAKLTEEALAESELRFRSMADSAPVLIWVAGTDGLFNYFNKTWLEFRGRTLEQESGNGWANGLHPESFRECLDTFLATFTARTPFRKEFRLQRFDGAYRWMLNTGAPRFAPDGAFSGFIGTCIDITELKETEEQLRQSQKMEAVGRLAGGIAHDFNNLLTAINGYSDLALVMATGDATLIEYLQEIKNSGERAASLTQQLLAYSRKQILAPTILYLNSTVGEMDRMLRRVIGEDIELVTRLEPTLGMVKADAGQIQQIILNLALNARDAMPQGGRLTLETASVVLDRNYVSTHLESEPGPHILLAVSDTGTGMSDEVKAKIFEPFFTTKEVGKGTGLGLSSVYGIIKQSGGSIVVYSEAGQGTTFKVYLPIVAESGISQPKLPPPDDRLMSGTETIMVVEDEEAVRRFLVRALRAFGYRIQEANNAQEALALLENTKAPDLMLTDVTMPGLSGRHLATKVLSQCPDCAILFMSGYTDHAIVHDGVLDSDAMFLQKPFSQSELLKKVRETLDSRSKRPGKPA